MDDLALIGTEDPQRADVAGCLTDHDVTRITEDPGEQIETLLRSDGDHHIVRMGGNVLQPHHVTDRFANCRLALAGAVLHGATPIIEHQIVEDRTDDIQREIGDVGHAAGE